MNRGKACVRALLVAVVTCASAGAAHLEDGVLKVAGKPFFPLGSWCTWDYTTIDDVTRLGLNAMFHGAPQDSGGVAQFRRFMRECDAKGVQIIASFSPGGRESTAPWPQNAIDAARAYAEEPNLLAFYIGDDVQNWHLAGQRHKANVLHEITPGVPVVSAYTGRDRGADAESTYTNYVDIPVQWKYPLPESTFTSYRAFFDEQHRVFGGPPLWTWVQNFMWDRTADYLRNGTFGPGPLPDPEQLRLLSFAALTRGVRGLLYFSHHNFHRMPELSAEVALICREVRLFNDHLAAGEVTTDLVTTDSDLAATAFRYGNSTVIATALFRDHYHRWVDEAVVREGAIFCPWPEGALPKAVLLDVPDVVECRVERASSAGKVRVVVPELEVAGFVLVTDDEAEIERLRLGALVAADSLRRHALAGAVAQSRKVMGTLWQIGYDGINTSISPVPMSIYRATERCGEATIAGESGASVRAWRETLRGCRVMLDSTMRFAESRRHLLDGTKAEEHYLQSPYGLHNLHGLLMTQPPGSQWRFVRSWLVTGPFHLGWDHVKRDKMPVGFLRPYPPETDRDRDAVFDTEDGPGGWRRAEADITGRVNFLEYFTTTDDVVCYARCRIVAPRAMDVTLGLGTNDGARLWVNGGLVYSEQGVRSEKPNAHELAVHLNEGSNDALVKVENTVVNWWLYLAANDPKDELRFVAE